MSDALLYNIAVDTLVTICGLVICAAALWVIDRYWLVWDWWPLVGPDWRAERHDRKQLERTRRELARAVLVEPFGIEDYEDAPRPEEWPERITERWDEIDQEPDDESWADELHAINTELHAAPDSGRFGDLTRPVAQLTHYEVEAVIVQLGRADWLPAAA